MPQCAIQTKIHKRTLTQNALLWRDVVLTMFSAGNYVIRSAVALKREVFRFNPKSGWRREVLMKLCSENPNVLKLVFLPIGKM